MDDRCDEISQCQDESDEYRCDNIIIDEDKYRQEYVPLSRNKENPLQNSNCDVEVSIDLYMLNNFEEIDLSYRAKFLLTLKWFDSRLTFANLKNDTFKNLVGKAKKEMLWIPTLMFNNTREHSMLSIYRDENEPIVNIFVEKSGNKNILPPSSSLDETYTYRGLENRLVLRTEYSLTFDCQYELHYYPFDTQICNMAVSIFTLPTSSSSRHNGIWV